MLLLKELEKLKNYIIVLIFKIIYYFNGPTKDIDFNDFIDVESLFEYINSKKIRFEDVGKKSK